MIPLALNRLQEKVLETSRVFPWYESLLAGRQEDGVSRISDLPLMTSELLQEHYYTQPDDPSLAVYRTSGTSSGRRKAIFYSKDDDQDYMNIKTKLFGELLTGSGCAKAVADLGTGHAASTALDIFSRLGLTSCAIPFELPIEKHLEHLQSYQPDLLYTMPSILDHIAHAASDPRAFGIRRILLVGEIATPEWQQHMAHIFGLDPRDITDTYGSIEIGTIAYYDHDLGRYLIADGIYAEGIGTQELDGELDPLGEGEQILALTSFVRTMLPSIRYVTYDVVRDFRPVIINGIERQSFRSIVKRVGRELKHGEKISLYDIEQAVYRHAEDAIIRVKVQSNALKVYITSKSAPLAVLPAIRNEIRACIPEIGAMIHSGLLDDIEVLSSAEGSPPESGQIKNKKIYY